MLLKDYPSHITKGSEGKIFEFKKELEKNMEELKMKPEYANRNLNVGFSGGEKKKNEIERVIENALKGLWRRSSKLIKRMKR